MIDRDTHTQGLPRAVEFILAAAGLVVTSPMMGLAALAIAATSPGPVLYKQKRVGKSGKPFTLFKFRTMEDSKEKLELTFSGDPRVTTIGKILRKTKLDELPELINILKGEMSLVGPRPELPDYVSISDPLWQETLSANPGITDPTTIRMRNEEELMAAIGGGRDKFYREVIQPFKLRGYVKYLRKRSSLSDLAVLFHTLWVLLAPGSAPPPTIEEIEKELEKPI